MRPDSLRTGPWQFRGHRSNQTWPHGHSVFICFQGQWLGHLGSVVAHSLSALAKVSADEGKVLLSGMRAQPLCPTATPDHRNSLCTLLDTKRIPTPRLLPVGTASSVLHPPHGTSSGLEEGGALIKYTSPTMFSKT